MKNPGSPFLAKVLRPTLISAAALGLLAGCGGGSGGGGNAEGVESNIAPQSVDQLRINFFGSQTRAFDLDMTRLSGEPGNEFGTFTYQGRTGSFDLGQQGASGAISFNIQLPILISDSSYSWETTGPDTARLTLSWTVAQAYPFGLASENNPIVTGNEMFWFGGSPDGTIGDSTMTIDFVFSRSGGVLGDRFARINGYVTYVSLWNGGDITQDYFQNEFDTPGPVVLRLPGGGSVPAGYNPTFTPETPSAAVWTSLNGRVVNFLTPDESLNLGRIAFTADVNVPSPPILSSGGPEETGRLLVRWAADGVATAGGSYSYRRSGGDRALLAVRYRTPDGDVTRTFDFDFSSNESGIFLQRENGSLGRFIEDLDQPF